MKFDSVVFADSASLAALSCLGRLRAEREAGRKSVIVCLKDPTGASVIAAQGLAQVFAFDHFDDAVIAQGWIERFSLTIRRLDVQRVIAPLGLFGVPHSVDFFAHLRSALNVDKGRDLLFFEERPYALVPEAVGLRLAGLGVRLPPAARLDSPRRYGPLALRLITGVGVPPVYGPFRERSRLSASLKPAFAQANDWDPLRALGPKLQPVTLPWGEDDARELFDLATALGQQALLGTAKSFRRRMARHAATAGSRTAIERLWLSLPGELVPDPIRDDY